MADLQNLPAHVCLTASGTLIQDGKVLLVKHKRLGMWLTPGGHMETDELPHQTAEREFWEETNVKVKAVSAYPIADSKDLDVEFLPLPFRSNLHFISRENFLRRTEPQRDGQEAYQDDRGCEMHMDYGFLVEAVEGVEFSENVEEVDGIAWFTREEVKESEEIRETVKMELERAFDLYAKNK